MSEKDEVVIENYRNPLAAGGQICFKIINCES